MIISLTMLFISLLFVSAIRSSDLTRVIYLILLYTLGGIYLAYLDLYYVGLTYIIVYVGAIAILFLFILMIIQTDSTVQLSSFLSVSLPSVTIGMGLGFIFLWLSWVPEGDMIRIMYESNWYKYSYGTCLSDIHNLSILLMGTYNLILLLLGIILWIILIGIIGLIS
jgi:NADH-ubiquinone oxidoreductase chain 6